MAASIAHDINQPVAALVANGHAGLRWLAHTTPDLDETRAALQRMVTESHRASQVIGSIRAMCTQGDQEQAVLDANELIREVLALLDGEIHTPQVSVHAELIEPLPRVFGSRVQLQQVILNLLTNAVEALVSVTNRARVWRVKSKRHASGGVLITVEDSGPGINSQDIDRIFAACFTTTSHGMGLGLSMCRSIIEAHQGRLWVSPGLHHGSIVHVVLPPGERGAEASRSHPRRGRSSAKNRSAPYSRRKRVDSPAAYTEPRRISADGAPSRGSAFVMVPPRRWWAG
jgi:C4-dicarboxylate-specific signal transduction histidine kinase